VYLFVVPWERAHEVVSWASRLGGGLQSFLS
jgi:hypothetical protein